jgi:hypothetical protein
MITQQMKHTQWKGYMMLLCTKTKDNPTQQLKRRARNCPALFLYKNTPAGGKNLFQRLMHKKQSKTDTKFGSRRKYA